MLPPHGLLLEKPHAFKSRTELAIEKFSNKENPTEADLNAVLVVGQVEDGIAKMLGYILDGLGMSRSELEKEAHISQNLGERMALSNDSKPHPKCHAHAIVSGAHPKAVTLRAVLAKFKLRIDDPDNGCWLPENTAAKMLMPRSLKDAVPHSRIHRNNYYFWLSSYIKMSITKDQSHLRFQLSMIENSLKTSSFPPYVMLPASKEYQP
ncbi:AHH domain-containing protein [Microbulbifer sp. VTAC004]|uniref:AHH domain-containing protein n=1 Tax=unclassified Microbulbifer TaxID=2619833 RepID=UPI00403911C9